MALTYVRIRAARDKGGPGESVRVLVDTGATYSMLPRRILETLEVVRERRVLVRLGDGRLMERDLGTVFVRYRKYWTPTWVMFGERGDASVLGALTLEELGLQVDPRSQRLVEVKEALLVSSVDTDSEQELSPEELREVAGARRQVREGKTVVLESLVADG